MAARTLRHYATEPPTANVSADLVAAVPAGRALVGKVLVNNNTSAPVSVFVWIGTGNTDQFAILSNFSLAPGEVYTETGVVLVAGERAIVQSNTAAAPAFQFFGEEVDN